MANEITPVAVQAQPAAASVKPSAEAAPVAKPEEVKKSGEQSTVATATPAPEQGKKLDTVA